MRFLRFFIIAFVGAFAGLARAEQPANTSPESVTAKGKEFRYPADIRAFRSRALKIDGPFAPDIAFSIRKCPRCSNDYVYGHYPRMRRQPWDSLKAVHAMIEQVAIKNGPAPAKYSPLTGRDVPRACPVCREPENGALADRVLFCHVIPETGDDVQIEYTIQNAKLASKTFWRMNKEGEAAPVTMASESETDFKKAFGLFFSLRAVWTEIIAAHAEDENVYSQEVARGVYFIFRPGKVNDDGLAQYIHTTLKKEKEEGRFTRLDSPMKLDRRPPTEPGKPGEPFTEGTYVEWAADSVPLLDKTKGEMFVGISFPDLKGIADEMATPRGARMSPSDTGNPYVGLLEKGNWGVEFNFSPLLRAAVLNGLSLHQACALNLDDPVYTLDNAMKLEEAILYLYPACVAQTSERTYLTLKDPKGQERKINIVSLARNMSPKDEHMMELLCTRILAWDRQSGGFGPAANPRDVSPTGLPSFIEKRIRPERHLNRINLPDALNEPREDSAGKGYSLCYTSECTTAVVYVDPNKDRFKGMTIDQARKMFDQDIDALPIYLDVTDNLRFPGERRGLLVCKVALICGVDCASLAADDRRASMVAKLEDVSEVTERVHFYALSANMAAVSPRKLSADEFKLVQSRLRDLAAENRVEPGLALDLYFDLPRVAPRGRVLRRK